MFRRISLIIPLIVSLGVGIGIAGAAQKDKAKSKEQADTATQQKEKEKTLFEGTAPGWFGLEMGTGDGYLGVYLEEVTPERTKELRLTEERGAIVMKVVADSPAEKSGFKENDVIVAFNGRRVDSVRELQRLLRETPPDRAVQIEVIRGGSRQTVTTSLAKRSSTFRMLDPTISEQFYKRNEEAAKQAEEAFKRSQEAFKNSQERFGVLPRDFGDFTFVNPGEFTFFRGSHLGISAESLTEQLADFFGVKEGKGVLVASVDPNSAAGKAGIKAGDVITAVDQQRIDSVSTLLKALSGKKEGTITVKIVRNRSEQTVNVTLEKREPVTPRQRALAFGKRATAV